MKKAPFLFVFLPAACLWLAACATKIQTRPDAVTVPEAKPKLQAAKQSLKNKQQAATQVPPVLGGLVQSDSWVIYKDKQQEEFKGHVSYDNDYYSFRSDYALSERALSRFSARGNVFLRQKAEDGTIYEAHASRAVYNYKTQKGHLYGSAKKPVKLVYSSPKENTVTATAENADFDLTERIFILQKDVRIERPTETGLQTLTAQKATFKQAQDYAILEGDARLTDGERTVLAETIIYDGQKNTSYAYGARPLAYGTTEQGTFAIIADKVQSDNEGHKILLDGQVQGWLVSPQINDSPINSKF